MNNRNRQNRMGMGPIPHDAGTAFRVWAPHADAVYVSGTFNEWSSEADPLSHEANGYWYGEVAAAGPGDHYRYVIVNGEQRLWKIDPYAREVTHSNGNGIIHEPEFDWHDDACRMPPWNELVIYELHVGTFFERPEELPGEFEDVVRKFEHLRELGINVIEIMPCMEFAGDLSWGYNPAQIFAIEESYGGTHGFKEFVRRAHAAGFTVIVDVVYNHFGPSDLSLWQFDGWSENGGGGIYFYNDWRADTPWGHTRPDYGRPEVRQYIRDNAHYWFDEFHVDGLRFDATATIRQVEGSGATSALDEGWWLMQWINRELRESHPRCLTIAEDLRGNEWLTRDVSSGGAGFGSQWSSRFVHTVRGVLTPWKDAGRSMTALRDALVHDFNGDPFQRVIYSESHDEVANGKAPLPAEINPEDPESWESQKRSLLGAVLTLTAPGIPMLFQGQEFLHVKSFTDTNPLDWERARRFAGITQAYRDLIGLRRNRHGTSRGLTGSHISVFHVNDRDKVLAYHRWHSGGVGDDVVVALNFSHRTFEGYEIGFPHAGLWRVRFSSDWSGYSSLFGDLPTPDVGARTGGRDGMACRGFVNLAPYSAVILTRDG